MATKGKLDDLIEKAMSPELGIKATKAKRSALARSHHILLKHYHRQKGGDGINYDADALLDELEKKDFQLEREYANAVEHEINAHAVSKAVVTMGNSYKKALKDYLATDDLDKKAELGRQLELYKSMGQKIGVDAETMATLKKEGFTPEGLYQVVDHVDKGVKTLDVNSFLEQIPKELAYAELDKLAKKYSKEHEGKRLSIDAVKAAGADAAKGLIILDREVKGNDNAFYEAAKKYYLKKSK